MANPFAFVTLLTSDSYLPGALALAGALKDVHPSPPVHPEVDFQTVCLVTPETVDVATIKLLRRAFNVVIGVELIGQDDDRGLQLLAAGASPAIDPMAPLDMHARRSGAYMRDSAVYPPPRPTPPFPVLLSAPFDQKALERDACRPDLHAVLTKLHIFRLIQYQKIIFLDADVLPIRPLSHLFHIAHPFSAVPDVGWPDCFNSGVLVVTPGNDKFDEVRQVLSERGSWDGGDQGVLNEWRGSDWNRLSFTYNTTPTAAYTCVFPVSCFPVEYMLTNSDRYAPAYERFGSEISAIHFIGPNKPWKAIPYRASGIDHASQSNSAAHSPVDSNTPVQLQANPAISCPQAIIQAYDYDSLVDRWFAVYDAHYRSQSLVEEVEAKRYMPAWDSQTGADMLDGPSRAPSGSSSRTLNFGPPAPLTHSDGALSLEDLRRLAVEGMGQSLGGGGGSSGEGEYLCMPLDGRMDLLRPRRIHIPQDEPTTPVGSPNGHNDDSPVRWTTLPTPGPNDVPPAPHLGDQSLPVTPVPPPGRFRRGTHSAQLSPTDERAHRPEHQHHGKRGSSHFLRVPSPPLLAWNPSVEPPPRDTPSPSAFPSDMYFTNLWDHKHTNSSSKSGSSDGVPDSSSATSPPQPDSGAFFETCDYEKKCAEQQTCGTKTSGSSWVSASRLPGTRSARAGGGAATGATGSRSGGAGRAAGGAAGAGGGRARREEFSSAVAVAAAAAASGAVGQAHEPLDAVAQGAQAYVVEDVAALRAAAAAVRHVGAGRARAFTLAAPAEREKRRPRRSFSGTTTPPAALGRPSFIDKTAELLHGLSSPFPPFRSPSGFRAPAREAQEGSSASPSPTRRTAGNTTPKQQVRFPAPHERRMSETSTTSVASPPSSVGPMSPAEGQPIGRTSGRVWDPARGVELFKRGSEEVLARFLKMGNWEEEGQQPPV
ncbi:glycosyltransferase family 8 protein [Athelia psychrophila]|uniref:Glycosyltransferase family 8 protein n=1 Tax=Athelia psychrophila TaxID=1759441 RepID=A0A166TYA1_9AGAM|nr:glycosyltransferase family 8 protein [Fibularhizoctonia sp. CBS 109695]